MALDRPAPRSSSRYWRAVWRITRSGCPCEFCEVVGGADHRPFGRNGVDAAQQELAEAAGLLDLSEHRFHDLLPQPIPASPSCPLQFSSHSLGQRAADLSLDVGRVLGASRRDVSLDDARLEAREVGFAQISAVGGGLPGAATEISMPSRTGTSCPWSLIDEVRVGDDDLGLPVDGRL